jgi:hypothetical protein
VHSETRSLDDLRHLFLASLCEDEKKMCNTQTHARIRVCECELCMHCADDTRRSYVCEADGGKDMPQIKGLDKDQKENT